MDDERVAAYRLLVADVYELAGRSRRTSEVLAAAEGQSAARWHVLSVLTDGARTVPQVASRLGLARQSVQRVVDELAQEALVTFEANPAHRRSRLVALTASGRAVCTRLFDATAAVRSRELERAGTTAADLAAARATIRRLLDAMDPPELG